MDLNPLEINSRRLADTAADAVINLATEQAALESHLEALRERLDDLTRMGANAAELADAGEGEHVGLAEAFVEPAVLHPAPEAHTVLAMVKLYYDWDWEGAERGFLEAIELERLISEGPPIVEEVLYKAARRALGDPEGRPGQHRGIDGLDHLGEVVLVDQRAVGRTPRANPLTYTKALDPVRKLLADTEERGAIATLERLRHAVVEALHGGGVRPRTTAGVVQYRAGRHPGADEVVAEAEAALYAALSEGGDCTTTAP